MPTASSLFTALYVATVVGLAPPWAARAEAAPALRALESAPSFRGSPFDSSALPSPSPSPPPPPPWPSYLAVSWARLLGLDAGVSGPPAAPLSAWVLNGALNVMARESGGAGGTRIFFAPSVVAPPSPTEWAAPLDVVAPLPPDAFGYTEVVSWRNLGGFGIVLYTVARSTGQLFASADGRSWSLRAGALWGPADARLGVQLFGSLSTASNDFDMLVLIGGSNVTTGEPLLVPLVVLGGETDPLQYFTWLRAARLPGRALSLNVADVVVNGASVSAWVLHARRSSAPATSLTSATLTLRAAASPPRSSATLHSSRESAAQLREAPSLRQLLRRPLLRGRHSRSASPSC